MQECFLAHCGGAHFDGVTAVCTAEFLSVRTPEGSLTHISGS
jgi:hypothetical protein